MAGLSRDTRGATSSKDAAAMANDVRVQASACARPACRATTPRSRQPSGQHGRGKARECQHADTSGSAIVGAGSGWRRRSARSVAHQRRYDQGASTAPITIAAAATAGAQSLPARSRTASSASPVTTNASAVRNQASRVRSLAMLNRGSASSPTE